MGDLHQELTELQGLLKQGQPGSMGGFWGGVTDMNPWLRSAALLSAAGLGSGLLSNYMNNSWYEDELRSPSKLSVYVKKTKPKKKKEKEASIEKGATVTDQLLQFGFGKDPDAFLGGATRNMALMASLPWAAMGAYNLYNSLDQLERREKLKAKLKKLEEGAIPKFAADTTQELDVFADAWLEGLAKEADGETDTTGVSIKSMTPWALQGAANLAAILAGAGLGAGSLAAYNYGRSQWKPEKRPPSVFKEPQLSMKYVDPETGEVWEDETSARLPF